MLSAGEAACGKVRVGEGKGKGKAKGKRKGEGKGKGKGGEPRLCLGKMIAAKNEPLVNCVI